MKILQVIPYFCFGGAETMCENLTYALSSLGHEVCVVSLYDEPTPISARMEKNGVRILYLDKKLGMDVSMVPKLMKIMKQEQPDVVHTHLDVVKYAALAAKLTGIRRCVHTVHNVAHMEAEGLARKINKVYFRTGLAVPVALNPLVQKTICEVYGLLEDMVPVVYNGVDLSRCLEKTDYRPNNPMTLVHIGRFNEQKNHAGLLEAFRLLLEQAPNCRLNLLGDGELLEPMRQLAREKGIADKVFFLGSQSNVHPYLQEADLFVLPSNYEGMPMTIIEAMGTGLPIVATDVGGVADMVTDGESALLTPVDAAAVSAACARLVSDEDLRRKLGRKALEDSRRFSAEYMAKAYCALYGARV